MKRRGKIHIGTSGWHYDHWMGLFYPEGLPKNKMLEHYTGIFSTVEINNSFYHLPKKETFESWRRETPKDFVFAVKASRYLTHMKKLKDPQAGLERFLEGAVELKKKLGPILFQLPPHWHSNPERLDEFLNFFPRRLRCAFELRDVTWFNEDVLEVLRRHKAAFCIWQLKGVESPKEVTADFVYIRMHGPTEQAYQGSYDRRALEGWAKQIRDWAGQGLDVYIYFDNDQLAHAPHNAQELLGLI